MRSSRRRIFGYTFGLSPVEPPAEAPVAEAPSSVGAPSVAAPSPGRPPDPAAARSPGRPEDDPYRAGLLPEELPAFRTFLGLGFGLDTELALARVQLHRALQLANSAHETLCDGKRCPQALVDARIDLVAKLADRCRRAAGRVAPVVDEVAVQKIVDVIARHVTDPEALETIARELEALGDAEAAAGPTRAGNDWEPQP